MRRLALALIVLCLIAPAGLGVAQESAADQTAAPPPPCSAPEGAQLDFWVGEWDLTWNGGSGTNVTRIMGGCVVQEQFSGNMGNGTVFKGMSVSTYDPNAGLWKQTWVDNQGGYLDFEGGMDGDRMVLSRSGERNGRTLHQRMVFKNITQDALDWDWETSKDGGATWTNAWAIHYQRR